MYINQSLHANTSVCFCLTSLFHFSQKLDNISQGSEVSSSVNLMLKSLTDVVKVSKGCMAKQRVKCSVVCCRNKYYKSLHLLPISDQVKLQWIMDYGLCVELTISLCIALSIRASIKQDSLQNCSSRMDQYPLPVTQLQS